MFTQSAIDSPKEQLTFLLRIMDAELPQLERHTFPLLITQLLASVYAFKETQRVEDPLITFYMNSIQAKLPTQFKISADQKKMLTNALSDIQSSFKKSLPLNQSDPSSPPKQESYVITQKEKSARTEAVKQISAKQPAPTPMIKQVVTRQVANQVTATKQSTAAVFKQTQSQPQAPVVPEFSHAQFKEECEKIQKTTNNVWDAALRDVVRKHFQEQLAHEENNNIRFYIETILKAADKNNYFDTMTQVQAYNKFLHVTINDHKMAHLAKLHQDIAQKSNEVKDKIVDAILTHLKRFINKTFTQGYLSDVCGASGEIMFRSSIFTESLDQTLERKHPTEYAEFKIFKGLLDTMTAIYSQKVPTKEKLGKMTLAIDEFYKANQNNFPLMREFKKYLINKNAYINHAFQPPARSLPRPASLNNLGQFSAPAPQTHVNLRNCNSLEENKPSYRSAGKKID